MGTPPSLKGLKLTVPWERDVSPGPQDPEGVQNHQKPLEGSTSQTKEIHPQEGQLSKNKLTWLTTESLLKKLVFKTIC